jgi:RNA polymerase sigma-70 factor (ECF subfamily)
MSALDDKSLEALHAAGAAAWPDVDLPLERFRAAVEAALEAGSSLESLHATELYLAAGCLAGDRAAIAAFERDVMGAVRPSVERACRGGANADDIVQGTLAKLLAGPPEPKLAQYTGKGSLVGWVRVVAVREALQARRRSKKEIVSDEAVVVGSAPTVASLEMRMLKEMHGPAFGRAVQDAMRRLTVEQRALLRFHVRDGLGIDQIAPMLGIHRATAARRLEKARADVLEHVQAILRERHGLSESEVKSLCAALGNEVDVSLGRALADEAPS